MTAEGFASGLPETIQKHLQAVQASGSLRGLQDKVNQLEASYLNQKGVVFERGVIDR